MSEKRYVVPDGMHEAAVAANQLDYSFRIPEWAVRSIEVAALRWQAENPKMPTEEEAREMVTSIRAHVLPYEHLAVAAIAEWQRRMYLAPEDDFERDCAALISPESPYMITKGEYVNALREAYNRGRAAK